MAFQSALDKSDREDVYSIFLSNLHDDSIWDLKDFSDLVDKYSGKFDLYIRFGYNAILDCLQDEIDNNGDHKTFIQTVGEGGKTIQQEITTVLI